MLVRWHRVCENPIIVRKSVFDEDGREVISDAYVLKEDGTFFIYLKMARVYGDVDDTKFFQQRTAYYWENKPHSFNESIYLYDDKENEWVLFLGKDNLKNPAVVNTEAYEILKPKKGQSMKYTIDITKEKKLENIRIFGTDGLFTDLRVDRDTVPKGVYIYELREGSDGDPIQLKEKIIVNFFGTVITKEPIPNADKGRDILWENDDTDDFYFTGEYYSLDEFLALE